MDTTPTQLWRQLESGSCRVIDHVERDDRRYLLVREEAARALTRRERDVIEHARRGWSNKEIAYELGLATSTVSTHLSHAAAKLGITSRAVLIQVLVALAARPQRDVSIERVGWAGRQFVVIVVPTARVPDGLSPAERAIVTAVVAGKMNADIARARGVSVRTVANQLASAMAKLGVRSRAELTAALLARDA